MCTVKQHRQLDPQRCYVRSEKDLITPMIFHYERFIHARNRFCHTKKGANFPKWFLNKTAHVLILPVYGLWSLFWIICQQLCFVFSYCCCVFISQSEVIFEESFHCVFLCFHITLR